MNLPNQLSLLRILLVPGILASLVYYNPQRDYLRWVAVGLFLAGLLSDGLDGFLARRYRQQTPLGAILDPLADKALILSTLISCTAIEGLPEAMRVPAWFNLVVISRDALLVIGSMVLFASLGRWCVKPNLLGKAAAVSQMLVILLVLLALPGKSTLLVASALLTVLSAISYLRIGIHVMDEASNHGDRR